MKGFLRLYLLPCAAVVLSRIAYSSNISFDEECAFRVRAEQLIAMVERADLSGVDEFLKEYENPMRLLVENQLNSTSKEYINLLRSRALFRVLKERKNPNFRAILENAKAPDRFLKFWSGKEGLFERAVDAINRIVDDADDRFVANITLELSDPNSRHKALLFVRFIKERGDDLKSDVEAVRSRELAVLWRLKGYLVRY